MIIVFIKHGAPGACRCEYLFFKCGHRHCEMSGVSDIILTIHDSGDLRFGSDKNSIIKYVRGNMYEHDSHT